MKSMSSVRVNTLLVTGKLYSSSFSCVQTLFDPRICCFELFFGVFLSFSVVLL